MTKLRPSNIFIRASVLIFASVAIFVLGSIFFHAGKQTRESPERFEQPEQGLLK